MGGGYFCLIYRFTGYLAHSDSVNRNSWPEVTLVRTINPQFKSDFVSYVTLIHSQLHFPSCPQFYQQYRRVTGLCPVTLPPLSSAGVFSVHPRFFSGGREDEQCCLISSFGIIAFLLNPSGSQFAASEVWSSIMMGYWPVCCLATGTEANWKDSSCFSMWHFRRLSGTETNVTETVVW